MPEISRNETREVTTTRRRGRRPAAERRQEAPAVKAEKARSTGATSEGLWLCLGPEWPPEDETCGKMISHQGRCKECSALRTKLRKADRRAAAREAQQLKDAELEFAFPTA